MPLWERLRIPKPRQADQTASTQINDLRLAASFVKSIETEDATLDVEMRQIAQRIENIAKTLAERARSADRMRRP